MRATPCRKSAPRSISFKQLGVEQVILPNARVPEIVHPTGANFSHWLYTVFHKM